MTNQMNTYQNNSLKNDPNISHPPRRSTRNRRSPIRLDGVLTGDALEKRHNHSKKDSTKTSSKVSIVPRRSVRNRQSPIRLDGVLTGDVLEKRLLSCRIKRSPERKHLIVSNESRENWKKHINLETARRLTNLTNFDIEEVFKILLQYTDSEGFITRPEFNEFFRKIIKQGPILSKKEKVIVELFIDAIYLSFCEDDQREDGRISYKKLCLAISVLTSNHRDDKVSACVHLLVGERRGEPHLNLEQFTIFLTAVFKILYLCKHTLIIEMGVGPEELALVTSKDCLSKYGCYKDNTISLSSIQKWYRN